MKWRQIHGLSSVVGFTTLELTVVVFLGLIITVISIPSLTKTQSAYRASGDGRAIAETLSLAKLRAGANFTKEQVTFDTINNTYQLEKYDKVSRTFQLDGGVKQLSTGVSFGYGSIAEAAGDQATLAQTSPMIFNSRGIPIDGMNAPTGEGAIYYNNSSGYFAVTVALSSRIQVWKWMNSAWAPQ